MAEIQKNMGFGYITTRSIENAPETPLISTDESVCGLLFDYSGFTSPFDNYPIIQSYFGDGQTICINNMSEASYYGLDDNNFLNGVPYYHISQYYNYIGADAPLYISFTNGNWNAITSMQQSSGGKIFQIGLWTSQNVWTVIGGKLTFSELAKDIENAVEELTGNANSEGPHPTPLSIIISPNTSNIDGVNGLNLYKLPDASELDCPKVSMLLMQNGTSEVHATQSSNPDNAPVGCIGLLMACMYIAHAEECIGHVGSYDLNKNYNINNAEIPFGSKHISIDDMDFSLTNNIALKHYIIPCQYEGKEGEVFFSGDPTMSNGDYFSIANNRIIHKCRRCIYNGTFPFVNGNYELDTSDGSLSANVQSIITDAIKEQLDANMIGLNNISQISDIDITIQSSGNILYEGNQNIAINFSVTPVNSCNVINEESQFNI